MCRDLVANYLTQGMPRRDVLRLLGPPDGGGSETELVYLLGMWSGFRIDYDVLKVELDEQSKVSRVVVEQH